MNCFTSQAFKPPCFYPLCLQRLFFYDSLHFLPLMWFELSPDLLTQNCCLPFFINLHKFEGIQWPGLHPPGQWQFKRANVLGCRFRCLTHGRLQGGGERAAGALKPPSCFASLECTIFFSSAFKFPGRSEQFCLCKGKGREDSYILFG